MAWVIDGKKIREKRLKKALSQAGLAWEASKHIKRKGKKVPIAESTISDLETGKTKLPNNITLYALAKALDEKPEELLKVEKEATEKPTKPIDKVSTEVDFSYEDYFNYVKTLRKEEYDNIDTWMNLYAIEHKSSGFEVEIKKETKKVVDIIKVCVDVGNNALFFSESGVGKSFMCVWLFEEYKNKFLHSKNKESERIPLFVELSKFNEIQTSR